MKRFVYTLLLIGTASMLFSCHRSMVYDRYEHTPVAGWEKNDTLSFEIPGMDQDGDYQSCLGLRITSSYPFMRLTLIVRSEIHPKTHPQDGMSTQEDTVVCSLIDSIGRTKGQGIGSYQYMFPVTSLHLQKGDSLHIAIRHDMKREILPGITDIGLQIHR